MPVADQGFCLCTRGTYLSNLPKDATFYPILSPVFLRKRKKKCMFGEEGDRERGRERETAPGAGIR